MARELTVLPRFKRDFRIARKHPEFEAETLEYVLDVLVSGARLPEGFREHSLSKRSVNWNGMTERHLGADLLLIYRVRDETIMLHRIGTHRALFANIRKRSRAPARQRRAK